MTLNDVINKIGDSLDAADALLASDAPQTEKDAINTVYRKLESIFATLSQEMF